jgi:AbiU2
VIRDNLVAHRDHSVSVGKVFENANVSPRELRGLALSYCEILNELLRATGRKSIDFEDYSNRLITEFEGLLDTLNVVV